SLMSTINLSDGRSSMLLGQMRRVSPLSCLQDRHDFECPLEELGGHQAQRTQAISVLHEMTQQLLNLFSTKEASAAWDKALLDRLCTGLFEQQSDLEVCMMQGAGAEEMPLKHEDSAWAVRKYFQGIVVYLAEKQYSPCAWEVLPGNLSLSEREYSDCVRMEIMRTFFSTADFNESIGSKDGDLEKIFL
uniref:Uncharacterized protein n=1 Tax=Oryctolagus cuniculus TaxID=9986 RepID=G1T9X6_RABIT